MVSDYVGLYVILDELRCKRLHVIGELPDDSRWVFP